MWVTIVTHNKLCFFYIAFSSSLKNKKNSLILYYLACLWFHLPFLSLPKKDPNKNKKFDGSNKNKRIQIKKKTIWGGNKS
jgi:hypothetical protein